MGTFARWDKGQRTMFLGILLTLCSLLAGYWILPVCDALGMDSTMLVFATRGFAAVCFTIFLGGAGLFRYDRAAIAKTWRIARPLIYINLGILVLVLFVQLLTVVTGASQIPDPQGIVGRVFRTLILVILVGINEEAMFRGLLFGGLAAGLGKRRDGVLWAAIISSLCFGFAHVWRDIDFGSMASIFQALLKTVESGMFGLILCLPVLETYNIVGAMIVHAVADGMLLVVNDIFSGGSSGLGNYVSDNPTAAVAACVIYLVICVLYFPRARIAVRRFRAIEAPEQGFFIKKEAPTLADEVISGEVFTEKGQRERSSWRKHRLFARKVRALVYIVLLFFVFDTLGSVIPYLVFGGTTGIGYSVLESVISIAVAVTMLLWFQHTFKDEFEGLLGWPADGLLLMVPGCLFLLSNIVDVFAHGIHVNPLAALVIALAPGIGEEVVFRAIPVSNWLRLDGSKRAIVSSAVVTSLVFGLVHGTNALAGASTSATVFQVFYATCIGVFSAALLLRTGSILPGICLHTLIDFTGFLSSDPTKVGILTKELVFDVSFGMALVASIVVVGMGIYMLRPAVQDEIVALWARKWPKTKA